MGFFLDISAASPVYNPNFFRKYYAEGGDPTPALKAIYEEPKKVLSVFFVYFMYTNRV